MNSLECRHCANKKLFSKKTVKDQKECKCKIEWLTAIQLFVDWCINNGLEISLPIEYTSLTIHDLAPDLLNSNVSIEYAINRHNIVAPDIEYISKIVSKYIISEENED